jgi:hypothetical protein
MQAVLQQAQNFVKQLGIDTDIAIKVLILAVASGVLSAVLDRVLGLPVGGLAFTFGWIIVALNGASYSVFKEGTDLGGLVMAIVSGLATALLWFVVAKLISEDIKEFNKSVADMAENSPQRYAFVFWLNELNILKVMLAGIIGGLLGFGWLALLRRLPKKLF